MVAEVRRLRFRKARPGSAADSTATKPLTLIVVWPPWMIVGVNRFAVFCATDPKPGLTEYLATVWKTYWSEVTSIAGGGRGSEHLAERAHPQSAGAVRNCPRWAARALNHLTEISRCTRGRQFFQQ